MVEATPSLPDLALARRMVATLSLQAAKRAVQRQVRASGKRWSELSSREATLWAELYREDHLDVLVAQAARTISKSPTLRAMLEREQRRCAKLINAQTAKPCSSATISVQKLGAKLRANQ
jgi:hypothetical protein